MCNVTTLKRRKEGNLIIELVMWTAMSINGGLFQVRRIIIKNSSDSNSRGFGGGADNNKAASADKKKKQQQQQGYLSIYLSLSFN